MRVCLLTLLLISAPALAQQAPAEQTPSPAAPPAQAPPAEAPPAEAAPAEAGAQSDTPPAPTEDAPGPAEAPSAAEPADAPPATTPAAEGEAPAVAADEGDVGAATAEGAPEAAAGAEGGPTEGADAQPAAAGADPSTRLLVIGLSDKGAGEALTASLNQAFTEQVAKSFVGEVVTRDQLKAMLNEAALAAVEGCDAEACMTDIGKQVDAGRVIAGNASLAGADVLLTLLVIESGSGKLLSSNQMKTPNDPEMVDYAVRNLTAIALTGAPADSRVPVRITVDADEPGTRLTIDGRDEGEAPKTVLLLPGDHKIVATLPGYEPTTQVISVEEATPMAVEVSLYWERFPLWPVAATLGVASFLTVTTGAALFMVGWFNYDGFGVVGAPFGNGHSYQGHTPATSSTLIATSQNVQLWAWAGTIVASAGVLLGLGALAFEVGDLSLLAVQSSQYNE